jgi:hypothetical protein
MNSKVCKKISRQADAILFDWLKTLVPEEDHDKINKNNFKQYLPEANYFYANNSIRLSFYSPQWVRKQLKKFVKLGLRIEDTTMSDLENYAKRGVSH